MPNDDGWLRVSIRLPFVQGVLTTEMIFDPGEAELLFKPRVKSDNQTATEVRELIEERRWRITNIATKIAASILQEVERIKK